MKSTFSYQTFVINVFKYTMNYTVLHSGGEGTIDQKIDRLRENVNFVLINGGKVKGGVTFVNDNNVIYACQSVLVNQQGGGKRASKRKYTRKSKRK